MTDTKNIPNKTIAILIVVALLVTIISTWVILAKIDSMQLAQTSKGSSVTTGVGNLAVKILPSSEGKTDSGQMTLNVIPN